MSYQSFAHLLGLGRRASKAARADQSELDADDFNSDNPADEQNAEDEDDKPQGKGKRAKGAKRAADDKDDADAEDEDDGADAEDEDDKPQGKRAKGAKRAADDKDDADAEDDDESPKARAQVRRAVKAERERCARIVAHGIQTGQVAQAAALAFDSSLSPKAALGVLNLAEGAGKPQGETLASRMSKVDVPLAGPGGNANVPEGVSAMAAAIIAAGQ